MFTKFSSIRSHLRARFGFANVVSLVALFLAMTGGAYAAIQLAPGSVGTKQLKNGAVTLKKISHSAQHALKGDKGDPGLPGTSVFASSVPSGQTIAGAWGGRYIAPQLAFNNSYLISTSFPVKAPVALSDATVNVAPSSAAGDADPSCTGSADNPTAPPGKVCVYISRANNATVTGFRLTNPGVVGTSPGDAYGFVVRILDTGTVGTTSGTNAEGTWAYTAP